MRTKPPTLRQRKTLPLNPASGFLLLLALSTISFKLPIPGLKYYLLLSFPIKQLFVPPFSLSLALRVSSFALTAQPWTVYMSRSPPRLWFSSIDTEGRRILCV